MAASKGLLMMQPVSSATAMPVIDSLTRKITAAYRRSRARNFYRGCHRCKCGVESDNQDHYVNGHKTNSLCIHYLAWHREEVPESEIAKVEMLNYGEEEPTATELHAPRRRKTIK